jgi:hypothetical protein
VNIPISTEDKKFLKTCAPEYAATAAALRKAFVEELRKEVGSNG